MRPAIALAAALLALLAATGSALGAVFTVTRFDDPAPDACAVGDCSLREALRDATANPGLDDVVLGEGTYLVTRSVPAGTTAGSLDYGYLANPGDVRIMGAGAALTIVRGQFEGAKDRILELGADDATITGLTIQGGESLGPGGGIWVKSGAALILVDAAVRDNASTSGYGGGIAADGTLTLTRATIAGNKAPGGNGGGVASFGLLFMTDTTLTGNSSGGTGGGLAYLYQGTITGGLVEGNTATTGGGIAFIAQAGTSSSAQGSVTGTVIRGNTATGSGGGISLEALATSSAGAEVSFTRITVSGNTAGANGGGVYARADNNTTSGATAVLLNSTISGNSAQQGGAIHVAADPTAVSGGQAILKSVTIAANGATVGGGLFAAGGGGLDLRNVLLGTNAPAGCVTSGTGTIHSSGHNLAADASCNGVLTGAGDLQAVDPRLGPLANNRGPTQTHALLAGSPAVDAGDAAACVDKPNEKLLLDQRSVTRLGPCDIGAFEAEVDLALDLAPAADPVTVGTAAPVTATVTNVGGHGATGVVVTLTPVPGAAGPTSVAATPSAGTCTGTAPVVCAVGPLAAGASATIALSLGTGAPGGLLVNGKVEAAEVDPDGSNDQDVSSTTVVPLPLPAGPVVADATSAPTLVFDPKTKRFLVRIQYRLKEASLVALCAAGCPAKVELRTRTGRSTFAATLKGDGKLVLGTRKGLTLAPGKRVRIDVPVPRVKLLKAQFTTDGAFRVTPTRLRVTLTTPSGKATTIRDGRIRVSIARIRSGALPGLAGILAQ